MIKGERERGRHREGILEGKRIEGDGKRGRHIFFNGIRDSSLLLMGFFTNRITDFLTVKYLFLKLVDN